MCAVCVCVCCVFVCVYVCRRHYQSGSYSRCQTQRGYCCHGLSTWYRPHSGLGWTFPRYATCHTHVLTHNVLPSRYSLLTDRPLICLHCSQDDAVSSLPCPVRHLSHMPPVRQHLPRLHGRFVRTPHPQDDVSAAFTRTKEDGSSTRPPKDAKDFLAKWEDTVHTYRRSAHLLNPRIRSPDTKNTKSASGTGLARDGTARDAVKRAFGLTKKGGVRMDAAFLYARACLLADFNVLRLSSDSLEVGLTDTHTHTQQYIHTCASSCCM